MKHLEVRMALDDLEYLSEAQAGDRGAFERLYRAHLGRVYALCLRLSGEPSRAEELTQEVFVRTWQKLSSFRGESAFSSWLHRLTVNVVLGDRRKRRRYRARVLPADDLSGPEPGAPACPPETGLDLERAIATLPPGARAVFVLHDVEGHRHEEIARLTGVSVGTSKTQLHRARKSLRKVLKP